MRQELIYVFEGPREGCAVQDSLMLQKRSSSVESAHANTEASVSCSL